MLTRETIRIRVGSQIYPHRKFSSVHRFALSAGVPIRVLRAVLSALQVDIEAEVYNIYFPIYWEVRKHAANQKKRRVQSRK